MKKFFLYLFLPFIIASFSFTALAAVSPKQEIDFFYKFTPPLETLTTEKLWKIAPYELNPKYTLWALERDTKLLGLNAVFLETENRYKINLRGVESNNRLYLRPDVQLYATLSDFSCKSKPTPGFHTKKGVHQAGQFAAELWKNLLEEKRPQLAFQLAQIKEKTKEKSITKAKYHFNKWLKEVDELWVLQSKAKVRAFEWKSYLNLSKKEKICTQKHIKSKRKNRDIFSLKHEKTNTKENKLLFRAPAKRWDGLFSIRLTIDAAGKRLNGKFLIDTNSEHNLISDQWLLSQGVHPFFVEAYKEPFGKVNWRKKSKLTKKVYVDNVQISGYPVDLDEFWVMDTSAYFPPKHFYPCCDGVLGLDFLRKFSIEFHPQAPAHVKFWDRHNFSKQGFSAVPAYIDSENKIVTRCEFSSSDNKYKTNVFWNTGNSKGLSFNLRPGAKKYYTSNWSLTCDNQLIAKNTTKLSFNSGRKNKGILNGGVDFLARSSFVIDFSNGKIWFDNDSENKKILKNQSGLKLAYTYKNGERALRVQNVHSKKASKKLIREGLKVGDYLTQVNDRLAKEMDHWEVQKYLSGDYGKKITLHWETEDGIKIVPFEVR